MKIYKCPKCGEQDNLHFNYDLTKQHRPIQDVLCNNCGEFFDGDMPASKLKYKYTENKGFSAYLEKAEQWDEIYEKYKGTPDIQDFMEWLKKNYYPPVNKIINLITY